MLIEIITLAAAIHRLAMPITMIGLLHWDDTDRDLQALGPLTLWK